jgi:hypothetical protein
VRYLFHFLETLSLLDREGNLSLTSIAVLVVLVKLVLTPSVSLPETGALLLVLANYAHRRQLAQCAELARATTEARPVQELATKLGELAGTVTSLEKKVAGAALAAAVGGRR